VPLFSVVYRLENYWHLPRLRRITKGGVEWYSLLLNSVLLLVIYSALILTVGFGEMVKLAGAGLLIGLMFQDVFLLSQHTHIPQNRSLGVETVRPFPPQEQEVFTRSLRFPDWFSRWLLIRADAHELHHMYPHLAGYALPRIPYATHNEVSWWCWTLAARRIPAEVFLYQNRHQSGFDI
jgi:fatty acid desaturase